MVGGRNKRSRLGATMWASALGLIGVALSLGCGSEAPSGKQAEPAKTCAEKFGDAPAWTAADNAALKLTTCTPRKSGLWACNERGAVVDCFTCQGVKTTFDPNDVGPGSLKALGVDATELAALQANYDTGCVARDEWDQYAPNTFTEELLCGQAMAGLKVCRNIDSQRQWWTIDGKPYLRRRVHATVGNAKGSDYVLEMPTDQRDVLDLARWPFLACDELAATKDPGWDLWIETKATVRTLRVALIEPKQAAKAPDADALARLAAAFKTCDDSLGNWE